MQNTVRCLFLKKEVDVNRDAQSEIRNGCSMLFVNVFASYQSYARTCFINLSICIDKLVGQVENATCETYREISYCQSLQSKFHQP